MALNLCSHLYWNYWKSGCFLSVFWQSCTRVSLFPCHGQLVCGCRPSYLRPQRETIKCETHFFRFTYLLGARCRCLVLFLSAPSLASYWLNPPLSNRLEIPRGTTICLRSIPQMQMKADARPVGTAATCSLNLGFKLPCGCIQWAHPWK